VAERTDKALLDEDRKRELDYIVLKTLAPAPEDRYQKASALSEDIVRFRSCRPIAPERLPLLTRWRYQLGLFDAREKRGLPFVLAMLFISLMVDLHHRIESDATENRHRTERHVAAQTKRGGDELTSGNSLRALPYLADAYSSSLDERWGAGPGVALRLRLGVAMQAIDAQRLQLDKHEEAIHSTAFSPSGRLALTATGREVRIWDVKTGRLIRTLSASTESDGLTSIAFLDDDRVFAARYVLADNSSGIPILWNAANGWNPEELRLENVGYIESVPSPDGSMIASWVRIEHSIDSSACEQLLMWDVQTRRLMYMKEFAGVEGKQFNILRFSPDGRSLALVGTRLIRILQPNSGTVLKELDIDAGWIFDARFSADGALLTVLANGDLSVWDIDTGSELDSHHLVDNSIHCELSPDGAYAFSRQDPGLHVWSLHDLPNARILKMCKPSFGQAVFSLQGHEVAATCGDNLVRIWDLRTGRSLAQLGKFPVETQSLAFSPDGRYMLTGGKDGIARIWKAAPSSGSTFSARHGSRIVAMSSNGERIAVQGSTGDAGVWRLNESTARLSLDRNSGQLLASLSDDGAHLFTLSASTGEVSLWDVDTGERLAGFVAFPSMLESPRVEARGQCVLVHRAGGSLVHTLCFGGDGGATVAGLDAQGRGFTWDARRGQPRSFTTGVEEGHLVALSPTGTRLAVLNPRGLTLYNAGMEQLIGRVQHAVGDPKNWTGTFGPDGERMLLVNDNGRVFLFDESPKLVWMGRWERVVNWYNSRDAIGPFLLDRTGHFVQASGVVWDTRSGLVSASLSGGDGSLSAISPDGQLCATARYDSSVSEILVWDAKTGGEPLFRFPSKIYVQQLRFSDDARRIVVRGRDAVEVWDLPLEQRSLEEVNRLVACRVPWVLHGGGLLPVTPRPELCQ
jgi:WD40 repeat protein